jgi:hypothetical protein
MVVVIESIRANQLRCVLALHYLRDEFVSPRAIARLRAQLHCYLLAQEVSQAGSVALKNALHKAPKQQVLRSCDCEGLAG